MSDILDDALQVVAETTIRSEIQAALLIHYEDAHTLIHVEEGPVSREFPEGTRYFLVMSEHALGIDDKVCNHCSKVYELNGNYVVLDPFRIHPIYEIIRALTDDAEQTGTQ